MQTFVDEPAHATALRDMHGIAPTNPRDTDGQDVFFDQVRVPAANIVGGPEMWNRGWELLAGRALDAETPEISATAFGIARAAVAEAWQYAKERAQFGKPISQHRAIRHEPVTEASRLQACRHTLHHAAWLAGAGRPCSIETSMAKVLIADTGVEIALACQQVMGAYALSDGDGMECHVRDQPGVPIVEGSSHLRKNNLASLRMR